MTETTQTIPYDPTTVGGFLIIFVGLVFGLLRYFQADRRRFIEMISKENAERHARESSRDDKYTETAERIAERDRASHSELFSRHEKLVEKLEERRREDAREIINTIAAVNHSLHSLADAITHKRHEKSDNSDKSQ